MLGWVCRNSWCMHPPNSQFHPTCWDVINTNRYSNHNYKGYIWQQLPQNGICKVKQPLPHPSECEIPLITCAIYRQNVLFLITTVGSTDYQVHRYHYSTKFTKQTKQHNSDGYWYMQCQLYCLL